MTADETVPKRFGRTGLSVVLIIVGIFCLAAWRVVSGSEHQAFAKGATAPYASEVTVGHTYSLAVPGGVPALIKAGVTQLNGQLSLSCDWSVNGASPQSLPVTAEAVGTKAETTVAHFIAPVSGRMHIACDRWGQMFVADADTGSSDPSGFFLLLSIITLTVGAILALSVGYQVSVRRAAASSAEAGASELGASEVGASDYAAPSPAPPNASP